MITPNLLLKVWTRNGMSLQWIKDKNQELGYTLPPFFEKTYVQKEPQPLPKVTPAEEVIKEPREKKIYHNPIAFRPNDEVSEIIRSKIPKGQLSKTINNAIKFYYSKIRVNFK